MALKRKPVAPHSNASYMVTARGLRAFNIITREYNHLSEGAILWVEERDSFSYSRSDFTYFYTESGDIVRCYEELDELVGHNIRLTKEWVQPSWMYDIKPKKVTYGDALDRACV